jgi:hypothetical protein
MRTMTDDTVLDTTIRLPPTPAGEADRLLFALDRSRAAVAKALAEGELDQPSKVGGSVDLRHVLVDLHDEYARHVGHADLLREAVDGLVGEDPPQS